MANLEICRIAKGLLLDNQEHTGSGWFLGIGITTVTNESGDQTHAVHAIIPESESVPPSFDSDVRDFLGRRGCGDVDIVYIQSVVAEA